MRVAFFTHYTELYGANRSLLNLIDGLRSKGLEPFVFAPANGDITEVLEKMGVPVAITACPWWVSGRPRKSGFWGRLGAHLLWRRDSLWRLFQCFLALPRVARQLNRWDVELVYTNSAVISLGALVAALSRRPHVWHLREFCDLDYGLEFDWGMKAVSFISHSDAVISVSDAIDAYHMGKFTNSNRHVVYNGVLAEKEIDELRQEVLLKNKKRGSLYTFAILGFIHPNKGQVEAIHAIAEVTKVFPECRLVIAGDGHFEPLKALSAELGVEDKVEFLGFIKNPFEVFLKADAVLMCSKHEAMGRVTVEAMLAGLPVVGFDQGGTSELIEHEKTGLLYTGSHHDLAENMLRLLENREWGRMLGDNAWQSAKCLYSTEHYAQSIFEVLYSIGTLKR